LNWTGRRTEWLAVDLGEMGFLSRCSQMTVSDLWKCTSPSVPRRFAHPSGGVWAKVAQERRPALRGEALTFELIFEEVGAGGDFKGQP